ncbi:hypothetical protein KUH03_16220 [Sphingobacterium sp. E70]|uniref:hypothetical protein n=1 Tax=Sphingobacterium sp. E70 TaxID=2853439 RepID=UPI00211D0FD0|nr:hypothetical protein [Sphingobacterium sp. E70]ULT28007.1 hypothetical protein KUH03_16220 [Sphingobacterium sp. E70]
MRRFKIRGYIFMISMLLLSMGSCKKDEYYKDGGLAQAKFDGSIMEYLDSKPREFDSIAQIIRLADWKMIFRPKSLPFSPLEMRVSKN